MTRRERTSVPRMNAAALAAQPPSVIHLVEFLERTAGCEEYELTQVPERLRSADVLRVAMRAWLIRIVVPWQSAIGTAHEVLGYTSSWIDYRQAGYPDDIGAAMEKDRSGADLAMRLHVRLTGEAREACIERRLRLSEQPIPADAIGCAAVVKKYHVTRKTLYDAMKEDPPRLIGYRRPGARKNSPYRVSESAVASLWLKRD
jgi:hypothetical protein